MYCVCHCVSFEKTIFGTFLLQSIADIIYCISNFFLGLAMEQLTYSSVLNSTGLCQFSRLLSCLSCRWVTLLRQAISGFSDHLSFSLVSSDVVPSATMDWGVHVFCSCWSALYGHGSRECFSNYTE